MSEFHARASIRRAGMSLIATCLAVALTGPRAHAVLHLGPQAGYQIYHRFAPEETPGTRAVTLLSLKFEPGVDSSFMGEIVGSYETGLDQFATQDNVNDRIIRFRGGVIYKPFATESPLFGLRLGGQYSIVNGILNYYLPPSTNTLQPRYWSPYFGAVLGMIPETGFGVEDEVTIWYDQYFKCLVYQMSMGIDLF